MNSAFIPSRACGLLLLLILFGRFGPGTVLTADAGLTRNICVATGLIAFCGRFALGFVSAFRHSAEIESIPSFFAKLVTLSLGWGAVLGCAAYGTASDYSAYHRFSGPGVKREAREFPITEAYLYRKTGAYHVSIAADARSLSHPFGGATFDVGAADWGRLTQGEIFVHHFNPSRIQRKKLCLTLPVEANGHQIRALAAYGTALPDGSVVPCAYDFG